MSSSSQRSASPGRLVKPLVGGVWNEGDNPKEKTISLDEFFARSTSSTEKQQQSNIRRQQPLLSRRNDTDERQQKNDNMMGELVGASPHSVEDEYSFSSASLMGTGFTDSSTLNNMEYSEDERSAREATPTTPNLLDVSPSRSRFLLDDDTGSSIVSEQSSLMTDDDAYFRQNPILPMSMLGGSSSQDSSTQDPPSQNSSSQDTSSIGSDDKRKEQLCSNSQDLQNLNLTGNDTEIYEDTRRDSFSFNSQQSQQSDEPLFEDDSTGTSLDGGSLRAKKKASFIWSPENQERGRFLANQLINKARDSSSSNSIDSATRRSSISTIASPSPTPSLGRKSKLTHHPEDFLRGKRLDDDFQIVDATLKQVRSGQSTQSSSDDSSLSDEVSAESSSSSEEESKSYERVPSSAEIFLRRRSGSSAETYEWAAQGEVDDFDDRRVFLDVEQSDVSTTSSVVTDGLLPRPTVEQLMAELNIPTDGEAMAAIQQMRQALQPCQKSNQEFATFTPAALNMTICGVKVRNYQAQVQQSVNSYRRNVLKISDKQYQILELGGNQLGGSCAL